MAIFRCKMCGGDLAVAEGASSCTCEFCGTQQTIPTVKDEGLQTLFNRANVLRMKSEFDKAADIYEKILQRSDSEAEAYWGLILCKYGIEYVEDPQTFKRIPTCHRASYDAVVSDEDYKNAIRYADVVQRGIYEAEAAAIDEIQKGIIALAQKADPYDIFICYKETDESGKRTPDSVIANDIYHQLTMEGFKVFYAAITLEDKLGTEYEPYIFSALNTAKVMLSLGTKPEYFNAVWVKNEWSRFLKIMKKDRSKLLIPCYRDMDPYELPEEFAHLQAQDMSKIGFINDIVRGIRKVIEKETDKPKAQETAAVQQGAGGTTVNAQIKRGNMALEDEDWDRADDFFEEALNLDPECAEAYLGKWMAEKKAADWESLVDDLIDVAWAYGKVTTEHLTACSAESEHVEKMAAEYAIPGYLEKPVIRKLYDYDFGYDSDLRFRLTQKEKLLQELEEERNLTRAKQYATGALKQKIDDALAEITEELDDNIERAQDKDNANVERIQKAYEDHIASADKQARELNKEARHHQEADYKSAVAKMEAADDVMSYENAQNALREMKGYKDSDALADQCQAEIDRLKEEARLEEERQAAIRKAEKEKQEAIRKKEAERAAKKRKTALGIIAAVAVACIAAFFVVTKVIIPNNDYNTAVALIESGDYIAAYEALDNLNDYKDSTELQTSIKSDYQKALFNAADVGESIYFGSYEQDNDTSNGKEETEWEVLAKEDGKILMVSKYALDCQRYNTSYTEITWENCSLRKWMNGTFMDAVFSSEEAAMIATTTNPDSDTEDQVFLLSIAEAAKYFTSDDARMCVPTAYAIAQGANTSDSCSVGGNATCWWWLRSHGLNSRSAVRVPTNGSINYRGHDVDSADVCVRPALWINLES